MNEKAGVVYRTTEYDKLAFIKGNREINDGHVKKLEKSMSEHGYIGAPIVVAEKIVDENGKEIDLGKKAAQYYVADGQHRTLAAINTKTPIELVVRKKMTFEEIITLNRFSSTWGIRDYVHHYATLEEREDYQWLEQAFVKYKGLPALVIQMVALRDNTAGGNTTDKIKCGKLNLNKHDRDKAGWELDYLNRYVDLARRVKGKTTYLYTALCFAYRFKECDHEELYEKLMKNIYAIEPQGNTMMYLRMFSEMYNKGRRKNKDKIYLDLEWAKLTGRNGQV